MHADPLLPAALARALAPFAPPQSEVHRVPVTRWNDDDLYEFDATTLEMFAQHSPQREDLQYLLRSAPSGVAMLHDCHSLARSMKVKHLGLWTRVCGSLPSFLIHEATA